MEAVNQLEKFQREQRERLDVCQETSSNQTEEGETSHEMEINCGTLGAVGGRCGCTNL